jgi:hypothetical protein
MSLRPSGGLGPFRGHGGVLNPPPTAYHAARHPAIGGRPHAHGMSHLAGRSRHAFRNLKRRRNYDTETEPETHAPDNTYQGLQAQFTEEEQVALTLLIVAINGWNRIQVGFRAVHPVEERKTA